MRSLHLFLSLYVAFPSLRVLSIFFNSISSPLLHVCFGLPLFWCSCGFQSRACLVFFKVCTIYLIWSSMGCFYGPILEIFIIYHHRLRTTKCGPFLGTNKGIFYRATPAVTRGLAFAVSSEGPSVLPCTTSQGYWRPTPNLPDPGVDCSFTKVQVFNSIIYIRPHSQIDMMTNNQCFTLKIQIVTIKC